MSTKIEETYIKNHQNSSKKYQISKNIFPNGVTHDARNLAPFPFFMSHAEGTRKWDVDQNEIIDYWGGHGALILGHAHKAITDAVSYQIKRGTHYAASTDLEIEWAQLIQKLIPSAEKVRFQSSGTEATMMALRMSRAFTGKNKIVFFKNHFHGWHDYIQSVSNNNVGIPDEIKNTVMLANPNNINEIDKLLTHNNDIAAIILEPTGAHMGWTPIRPSFLFELREITRKHGVVLIFDEVVTGFRTSIGGAQKLYGVTPDLCSLAKIVGGGLPAGAVAGKKDIINTIETGQDQRIAHYGTFNANPLSAAAGIATLNMLSTQPINKSANDAAKKLQTGLNSLLSKLEITGTSTAVGAAVMLYLGIHFDHNNPEIVLTPEQEDISNNTVISHQLKLAMYNNGIDGGPRFLLSGIHSNQDIEETLNATEKSLIQMQTEKII